MTTKHRRDSKRRLVALLGDTHGGNDHGLMSADTRIPKYDKGGVRYDYIPKLNAIQTFLDLLYDSHVSRCLEIAGRDELIVEIDGDISQGVKHISSETMTVDIGIQKAIAEANLFPWLAAKNVKTMRICEGTEAHDLTGNSMTYMVTAQLAAEYPGKDIKAVAHGLLDIDGYVIDYAHHGPPPGAYTWLKGNIARSYLRNEMMKEIDNGNKPPDLYHRAHYHELVIEELRVRGYKSMLIVTPSYTFPGAWTRQAKRSLHEVTNGMVLLELYQGKLVDVHELIERTDVRTRETL